jgi:hypothetical protein
MSDLIEWLRPQYRDIRTLDDGTIVATVDLMFTRAICIDLTRTGYDKRFCFDDRALADAEFAKLQTGDDEPAGFIARR